VSGRRTGSGIAAANEGFDAALELAPRHEDSPPTTLAANANVRPEPHNFPVGAATWVGLAQTHDVAEANLDRRHFLSFPVRIIAQSRTGRKPIGRRRPPVLLLVARRP
jgi:hypothetical protein